MAVNPVDGGNGNDTRSSENGCIRLLLVEDRRGGMDEVAAGLRRQEGLRLMGASDSGLLAGVQTLFEPPDAVLVSADLVGFTAWDTTRLIKQLCPAVCVIVVGSGSAPRWLRQKEAPDAIVEDAGEPAAIAELVRTLHARTRSAANASPCAPVRPGSSR